MNKSLANYIIDISMGIAFIVSFITGILKWPGLLRFLHLNSGNLPMLQITIIHDWSGLIMGILALAHIVLHWSWIVCITKSYFGGKKCD